MTTSPPTPTTPDNQSTPSTQTNSSAATNDASATTISSACEMTSTTVWDAEGIVSLCMIAVLLPVVVIGNVLVILSIIRYKRLQIPTNMFIMSLSISDILSGLFSPFLLIIELRKEVISDIYFCLAPYCGVLMGISVSIMTLAAIAFDRYTACVYPMEYIYVVTLPRIIAILATTWTMGIALTWIMILGMANHEKQLITSVSMCSLNLVSQNALIVLLTVVFLPCGIFIFFCYFKIYLVARHHVKAIDAIERSVSTHRQIRHFKRDAKYAKTLGIVITGFTVLSLPLEISILLKVSTGLSLDDRIMSFCVLLALLNGAINPWVYAFRNSEFRSAFRALIKECTWIKISEKDSVRGGSHDSLDGYTLSRCDSRLEQNGGLDIIRDVYGAGSPVANGVGTKT